MQAITQTIILTPSCSGSQQIFVCSSPGQHEVYNYKPHTILGYYIGFRVMQMINTLKIIKLKEKGEETL